MPAPQIMDPFVPPGLVAALWPRMPVGEELLTVLSSVALLGQKVFGASPCHFISGGAGLSSAIFLPVQEGKHRAVGRNDGDLQMAEQRHQRALWLAGRGSRYCVGSRELPREDMGLSAGGKGEIAFLDADRPRSLVWLPALKPDGSPGGCCHRLPSLLLIRRVPSALLQGT